MLRGHERRILKKFIDALIPPGDEGLGPGGVEARAHEKLEAYLHDVPLQTARLVPVALWVVELYPIAVGPGFRRFSQLSRPDRARVLERLETHVLYPLRSAYFGLKVLAFMFWAEDETVASRIGWGRHCT